jgi:hypothetical protein
MQRIEHDSATIDDVLAGYITCALWLSNDESDDNGGDPLDRNYSESDISAETMASMRDDIVAFLDVASAILGRAIAENEAGTWSIGRRSEGSILEYAGHDFWLTRNGHGAGFWDGDWESDSEDFGKLLTEASKEFGEVYFYIGDDGKIYS